MCVSSNFLLNGQTESIIIVRLMGVVATDTINCVDGQSVFPEREDLLLADPKRQSRRRQTYS